MIKELTDNDLGIKLNDLLTITRKFIEIENEHRNDKNFNPLIYTYYNAIELIIITMLMERIQKISEQTEKELNKKGLSLNDLIKDKKSKA